MSHEIARVNGKDSFMSKRQVAWHGLGQIVDKDITSKEAIVLAGLDYMVQQAMLVARIKPIDTEPTLQGYRIDEFKSEDGIRIHTRNLGKPILDKVANYRTDTNEVFGVVGKGYEIIQNIEAFDFFDSVLGKDNIYYETAGALKNGAVIFITAKVPQELIIDGRDVVDQYLLLTNSHDGSSAIRVMYTPVRVVCNNTLQMALSKNKTMISLRHTKNVSERLELGKTVLGFARTSAEVVAEQYNYLSKIKITDKILRDYIEQVFPNKGKEEEVSTRLKNLRREVLNYTFTGIGQQEIEGTAWWAYNGITGYFHNEKDYKSNEALMQNNIFGNNASIMQNALEIALSL